MNRFSHVNDLLAFGNQLVVLIQSHKIDEAAARIAEATKACYHSDAEARGQEIQAINHSMRSVKAVCARLRTSVENLPAEQMTFAKHQVEDAIEKLFTPEIHDLRRRKNELSKPR